ncbi:MAG: phosphocholine cytidylyltransferase family protein [Mariprofundaceae bacterium]|nr:phosphocholine cytidylyltransferase family protein [Mariprofundaceae bacterium]
MKCLIVAAGKGRRLQKKGDSKPLIPLCGTALIERAINQAQQAGIGEFYVVTGHQHQQVEKFLSALAKRIGVLITAIFNPDWQHTENGVSVLCAKSYLRESFLLLMSDHVFDASIASDLMREAIPEGGIILAVDRATDNPLIDKNDVTRVKTKHGNICAIGKNLADFDCFDTGIFLAGPALFEALEKNCAGVAGSGLSAGIQRLAAREKAATFDINGRFWIDVDDPVSFWRAENALLKHCHPDVE